MAISGKKAMGVSMAFLLVAVLLVAAAEASVTVYNPARIPLDVAVDGQTVRMDSGIMSMNITTPEPVISITTPFGNVITVDVVDGDVIVVLPAGLVGNNAAAVRVVPVPFYPTAMPPVQP